jgi:hypothetical protein
MPVSQQDDSAFLRTLFELQANRYIEAVVVPWRDKVAIISAYSHGNAEVSMGIFDIPMKDAKRLVKLAASDSISSLSIPPLIADDLYNEGDSYDIAPHLYVIWAVGDAEPFHEYEPAAGYDFFSMTGILEAIYDAENIPYPDEERLGVPEDRMMKWAKKLTKSKDQHVRDFGAFLADTLGKGYPTDEDEDEDVTCSTSP